MRTHPIAAALLLALAPGAFALPARAQTSAEDPTTAMARARFKEGVEFYDKGSFEQARVSFLQAYALKKHPAVLLNLAWSCLKSGHVLDAERYFKQFLAEGKDITDKQRADANDGLNQSHAKLGRIEIVAVTGTEVTIDGERVGTTPLAEPTFVEAGAHTVKFKGPDGGTDTNSVTVLAGEKAIARLAKAAAAPPTPPPSQAAETPPEPPAEAPSSPPERAPTSSETPAEAPSSVEHGQHGHGGGGLSLVPGGVGGVLVLGSATVAIVMASSKQSAQNKANSTASNIESHGGTSCSPPTPSTLMGLGDACASFISDNNQVNSDATIGNIAIGVGAAALAGTILYYVIAVSSGDSKGSSSAGTAAAFSLVPTIARSTGGLTLTATF